MPEFGESFRSEMPQTPQAGPKAGLTDTMSMMEMFRNPQTLALLKMADIDLVDIARMDQTKQQNLMTNLLKVAQMNQSAGQFDRSQAQSASQFQQGQALTGSAVTPQTITLPDGSQSTIPFRTHQGGGGGGAPQLGAQPGTLPPGAVQTKPAIGNIPIPPDDLIKWIDPVTLQPPKFGITPLQAQERGMKPISTDTATKANGLRELQAILNRTQGLMSKVFPREGGAGSRISEGLPRTIGAALQTNPNAAVLQSHVNGTLAPVIRALGEKGTLAEGDTARAKALQPQLSDSNEVAWMKMDGLVDLFNDVRNRMLGIQVEAKPMRLESKGKIYNIPKEMLGDFLKDNPDANQVR
jgi:hypothetical protein